MFEYNKSYQANSDIAVKQLIENGFKFDLILTDPPYNLNKDFGNNSDCLSIEEFIKVNENRIESIKELLAKNGSVIWFGIHHYICFIQTIMYQKGLHYRRMNIWFYENGFSRNKKVPQAQYEPFLWFSENDKNWTYNVDDVRVPYKSQDRLKNPVYYKDSKGNKKKWEPNPNGAMRGDIWQFPTLAGAPYKNERTSHPTQKPESLITELVKAFCPKNKDGYYEGTIFDPFHGSGTLGVCCEKLNKQGHKIKWIGIELEKQWNDISKERLKKSQKKQNTS